MGQTNGNQRKRVLLLTTPASYRTPAFLAAAERLGLEAIQAVDLPEPLAREWNVPLGVDFTRPERAAEQVAAFVREQPVDAILPLDDSATVLAALACARVGLPHNAPDAALAARDKYLMREMLAAGGVPVPHFQRFSAASDPAHIARQVNYPCVVKPTILSGSRGVIRADDPDQFVAAFARTRDILASEGWAPEAASILVEEFLPGFEVALEGLLTENGLQVLALFDKPDPLDGPFFEETIYVTPSRLPEETQAAIAETTARGAAALGLRQGPIHAELRINERGPWIIEMAGRSIGGLCSTVLEFGTGYKLEDLILLQAVGEPLPEPDIAAPAVGVMMIPIPASGILRRVDGVEEASKVPGITGIEITARLNHPIAALPEGASYLGFIFARAETPAAVEAALREAHGRLRIRITPEIRLRPIAAPAR